MGFNGKHLSLEDRKIIEENINKGLRKFETAKNSIRVNQEYSPWKCKHYKDCKVCIGSCSDFEEVPCFRRDRFIGACNGCSEIKKCLIHLIIFKNFLEMKCIKGCLVYY